MLKNYEAIQERMIVVMDATLGTPNFKPEKNLEFFRLKKIRRTQRWLSW